MIFRIFNFLVMGIAIFYIVEGVGLVEKRKYFPTLPRLEASASNPMAWLGAVQWGFNQLGSLASGGSGSFDTGTAPGSASSGFSMQDISDAINTQRQSTYNYLSGYTKAR